MPFITCQHIKSDGIPCGSPALRQRSNCFYHQPRAGHLVPRRSQVPRGNTVFLDAIHNRLDLLSGISKVVMAVAEGRVTPQRGNLLFKGLEIASHNLSAIERLLKSTINPA